jgi:hypothetical protein
MAEIPEITTPTEDAIWAGLVAAEVRHEDHPRLSASSLGDECERKLWYAFRWATPGEVFDGRKLSIFETGNVWEDRLVEYLRKAGMLVQATDPETGGQFRVTYAWGHGSGRTDGKVEGVPEAPKTTHLFEAKSSNQKNFLVLRRKGVREAKPSHFVQMQSYLHLQGLKRALYICVNKNDDALHVERVEYDAPFALALMVKAERIVSANSAPPKLHEDPAAKMAWQCGFCPARAVCHEGAFARRTCRSCLHSTAEPDGDGRWSCARHLKDLTWEDQRAGCPNHLYTPSLVPGVQTDADEAGEWVEYRMADGSTWRDGAS